MLHVVVKPRVKALAGELLRAILEQNHDDVIQILESGQDPDSIGVNPVTLDMDLPILVAARAGHFYSVHLLLTAQANVNATGLYGRTASHLAALADSPCTLEVLTSHGANVCARDSHGETPLFVAVLFERTTLIRQLLAAGADPWSLTWTVTYRFCGREKQYQGQY